MLRFCESFDAFHQTDGQPINTGNTFASKWRLDSGTAETTEAGRDTGKACGLSAAGRITRDLDTIVNVCVGFALKIVTVPATCLLLLPRFNTNVDRAQLILNSDRTLTVRCGNTTVRGTTVTPLNLDTWYYIEFKTKMTLVNGDYELRIDGVPVLADSGIAMDNVGVSGTNNVSFGAGPGVEVHVDDVYVLDCDAGPHNVDFLDPIKVVNRRPVMDSSVQFSPNAGQNWDAVSEVPPDGNTSYVQSSNVGDVDLFVMG